MIIEYRAKRVLGRGKHFLDIQHFETGHYLGSKSVAILSISVTKNKKLKQIFSLAVERKQLELALNQPWTSALF